MRDHEVAKLVNALRDVYEFHDLQRCSVGRSTYERAIQDTANRIRSAHPSLKVYVRSAAT